MTSVTLPAYAKVNLYLDVVGKRPDGYHELVTLFERIDLADEITIEVLAADRIEVCCDHPDVPLDETNLVVRAAQAYRQVAGWRGGFRITLKKRIPVAGGLGGGSSDAASTLLGLQKLTSAGLPEREILRLGSGLGADVPFFLAQVPWALGRGRGDELEPLTLPARLWHLLVAPGFPIPTQAVYRAFSLTAVGPDVKLLFCALRDNYVPKIRDLLFNTLEPTVEALYPAIRHVKEMIQNTAGIARPLVSGSGSTVIAVCSSREEAEAAAESLRRREPGWGVTVASTGV